MIVELQVLPSPAGTEEDPHGHVDAAIEVIKNSGLHCEVGALGTTMEGEPDLIWATLRAAHEAVLAAGATSSIAVVKIAELHGAGARSMSELVRKFR